ncbi:ATP-binding protein [Nonomuraea sp. LPB2021202275-12-8]|uniref:ATP-binding protein n=1 Tax=Nonomuraea sp. LPB2021202275-12-8 TaxID=3120159 RepID=UPI00300D4C21
MRTRLTALYAGLFLITSTILLVTVNLLLRNMLQDQVSMIQFGPLPPGAPKPRGLVLENIQNLPDLVLRFQWEVTAVTIVALTAVSVVAGWWLSGPPEQLDELFEPFRTRSADGIGLGLSIVASIARAHDATVTARPQPGGGLELTVSFAGRGSGRSGSS